MEWKRLLCEQRMRQSRSQNKDGIDLRSEFEKDYHRIIGSASFRRLQDKTQVFPLDQSDFIRTRLTHSLEVSSLAKSLGQTITQDILVNKRDREFTWQMKEDVCNILMCAGLIHDIGNPPFGHFGESAIRDWFARHLPELKYQGVPVNEILTPQMQADFLHFEGNAQALRLLTRLHFLVDEHGMNLTYGLLHTIVKYTAASAEINPDCGDIRFKKMGFFYAEQELFQKITAAAGTYGRRHPLTFILEAADDIAYSTADIEDAYKKGRISYQLLLGELEQFEQQAGEEEKACFHPLQILKAKYQSAVKCGVIHKEEYAVQNFLVKVQSFLLDSAAAGFLDHYEEIMRGEYRYDLFEFTHAKRLILLLEDIARRYVFCSKPIYKLEIAAETVLHAHLDRLILAVLEYDTGRTMREVDQKLIALVSENYKQTYHICAKGKSKEERLYLRFLLVTDYICGMTDSFAKRLYQELGGIW